MNYWPDILDKIRQVTGLSPDSRYIRPVSGGCINSCFLVGAGELQIFVKTNKPDCLQMFKAEAAGLNTITKANAILTPEVLCAGSSPGVSFIAMQGLKLSGADSAFSYRKFGRQLAKLHRYEQPHFGASIDNTIGSTIQKNARSDNWFEFWRKYRLGFQLSLASQNHAQSSLIDDGFRLNEDFESLFDKPPHAACLHGDLWQGNWGFTETGEPVIFDPAHYFGDRETDLAMSTLFGRAPPDFYAAYRECYPLRQGYVVRETFYNLYHILNHFNLFGGGYADQAHRMIRKLLSELV